MSNSSPVHFGKGSCKVSVYSPTQSLPYYRLCYRVGGRRYQRTRKTYDEAEEAAQAIQSRLLDGKVSLAQITQHEVAVLGVARTELAELGVRLDQAFHEYAGARRMLGGIALSDAVDFYIQHHPKNLHKISLERLVGDFLEAKRDCGVSDAYLNDLEFRLRSLVSGFDCPVGQLNEQGIAAYFKQLKFAPENHTNQLRVVRTLFNYAKEQGHLSESVDLLKCVPKKKIIRGNYAIYQPSEWQALLRLASPDLVPGLVLLGLCGVRPAEMRRLTWEDIRVESKTLIVNASNAKTASRRTVPICDYAVRILGSYGSSERPVWVGNADHWNQRMKRLHKRAGVTKLPNGLRHSYISYRLTLTGDVNRTALEAGNSASIIHRHYHALVDDPRLAEEWFGV